MRQPAQVSPGRPFFRYYEENIPLDALVEIADWLVENKENLYKPED